MTVKSVFATCVIITATAGGSYSAVAFRSVPDDTMPKDVVKEILQQQAGDYEHKIDKLKKDMPSKEALYLARAVDKFGHDNVLALAMNGANECPSSELMRKAHKCNPLEEAAIMHATLRLLHLGENGPTIKRVVYSMTGRYGKTPMFSWTVKKNPRGPNSKNMRDVEIFNNSMRMAAHILGGGKDYELANFGQYFFCNKDASKKKCSGHETNKNYVPLGKINFFSDMPMLLIKSDQMSKHDWYGLTEEYLRKRGIQ